MIRNVVYVVTCLSQHFHVSKLSTVRLLAPGSGIGYECDVALFAHRVGAGMPSNKFRSDVRS